MLQDSGTGWLLRLMAQAKIQIFVSRTTQSGPIVIGRYLFTELLQLGHDGIGCLV
jgi:hypothetical protein